MTPEQRAHEAWQAITGQIDILEIQHTVEIAVYRAVMAEREACAKIAESFIPSGFTGGGKAGNSYAIARDDRARAIARAIRARS